MRKEDITRDLCEKSLDSFNRLTVKTSSCWNWIGGKDRKGYGRIHLKIPWHDGKRRMATMCGTHVYSYILHNGEIPEGPGHHGFCVCHRCDNPSCVNPEHLFLGTNKDNVRDMDSKGRRISNPLLGEKHQMAILTNKSVRLIFEMKDSGATQKDVAKLFKCATSTVAHIWHGRQWNSVTGLEKKK